MFFFIGEVLLASDLTHYVVPDIEVKIYQGGGGGEGLTYSFCIQGRKGEYRFTVITVSLCK